MNEAVARVRAENVYKIFGGAREEALRRLEAGASKDEVYRETGAVVAVRDVSFSVPAGAVFVVMGLSGSGKSTLIRCVNRLIDPTSGRVFLDDADVMALEAEQLRELRLRKMAMVFQHFALFPHKTVGENVEYGLKVRGVERAARREKALEALAMVGLADWADTPPEQLSGGMQQRVGLARALAVDPELMLMDEPFSALDPLIRRDMQEELLKLQERLKMTIVFITHDLHEALLLGDRIAIMKDGAFVQVGTPEEIVADPADDYVADFTQDVDRSRVFTAKRVMRRSAMLPGSDVDVAQARAELERAGAGELYVGDGEGRPVGLVTAGDLARDDGDSLGAVMRSRFPTTRPEATLHEVLEPCREGLPVAVLGDDGRLEGVVEPLEVIAALSGRAREDRERHERETREPAPAAGKA